MIRPILAGALSLLLSTATGAYAADLSYPVKAAPVIVPVFSWTGFYVGGNVGYSWADIDNTDNVFYTGPDGSPFTGNLVGPFPGPDSSASADSWIAGGQVGYNFQFSNNWVVGIEADFQWTGIDTSDAVLGSVDGPLYESTGSLDWFGTVRARLGYGFDRLLVYGTGGFAYGKVKGDVDVSSVVGPPLFASGSDDAVLTGWTVGGGVEYALTDNWILRGEYLYVDLGDKTLNMQLDGLSGDVVGAKVGLTQNVLRAGVSYKF